VLFIHLVSRERERERERGRPQKAASSFNSKIKEVNVLLNSMKEQAHHPSPFVSEGLARFGGRLKRLRLRWLSPEVSPLNEMNPEEEVLEVEVGKRN
jgi:hypothetical protein